MTSRSRDFTEDERRTIVIVRDSLRYSRLQPADTRYRDAVIVDRHSEDYANDPDAINPPSRAHLWSCLRCAAAGSGGGPCASEPGDGAPG